MGALGCGDRAAVSDQWTCGASADRRAPDAAHVLSSAVVWLGRRGAGRRPVRHDTTARHCATSWASTLPRESVPDATTLLKFRRLLLDNQLTKALFEEINAHLADKGLLMRTGTIVDTTIIAAPSSTKNAEGKRDPEMHQTKKGNQWHFGMKAYSGVDTQSGLVRGHASGQAQEAQRVHRAPIPV